ncbi:DUF423 domain-containing protein [Agrobacterium rhizogenes]|nr:DUF423 domain-containing protein [Rhizobium rhizogenes]KAA6484750.1 DUF423 domain-containing protein [Agrobacterium sp. ICMP 7243]MDJ1637162.1 DUF423 domain-containing protein [Rhizobium rhizogenes]NTF49349.1 DUF423 domain-containing protein [Rhizobium rhizogenes]NTF62351.1 DUF423 domain-containing protein [Rhizobium rhizogenes]NTG01238.1 DUF423 domain-containing protein [Rhizobium rhizogenes]
MSLSTIIRPLTLFVAGTLGAAGVALAAAASHGGDTHFLGSASTMCLAHAPALLALYAGYGRIRTAPVATVLLGLGTLIFAGDLVSRHFLGSSLFPLAAPTGGMGMVAGWVVVALSAFFRKGAAGA